MIALSHANTYRQLDSYTVLYSEGRKLYTYFVVRRNMIANGTWNSDRVSQTNFRENTKKITKYLKKLESTVGELLLHLYHAHLLETDDMDTPANYRQFLFLLERGLDEAMCMYN